MRASPFSVATSGTHRPSTAPARSRARYPVSRASSRATWSWSATAATPVLRDRSRDHGVSMPRTLALIAAIAPSVYGASALSQAAPPPTAAPQPATPPASQPAQGEAGTSDEALTKAIYSALNADPNHFFRHVTV